MGNTDKIILLDSPETASYQTVQGWVSRHGLFFGKDEEAARYHGATHVKCKTCGEPTHKTGYMTCASCREKAEIERYAKRERKPWDGETMLYSEMADEFFYDHDEVEDYCYDNNVLMEDLRLVHCEPEFAEEIDPDEHYEIDDEEKCLPKEIEEAFEKLNEIIRNCKEPLCWYPGKFAVETQSKQLSSTARHRGGNIGPCPSIPGNQNGKSSGSKPANLATAARPPGASSGG